MADNNLDYNIGRKSEETKEEIIFKSGIPIFFSPMGLGEPLIFGKLFEVFEI